MSGIANFITEELLGKLIHTVATWQDSMADALEDGIGPYKHCKIYEVHQLLKFAEMFDDCLDKDDYSIKSLLKKYDKLDSHIRDMIPKSIVNQMEKLR